MNLLETNVAFGCGSEARTVFLEEETVWPMLWRVAVAVTLSKEMGASINVVAATIYFEPVFAFAVKRTLVVCPGAMRTVSVL